MQRFLKWTAGLIVFLGFLMAAGVFAVYALSSARMNRTYAHLPETVSVPMAPEAVAEGQRLYVSRGCGDCHGADAGGGVLIDDPLAGVVAGPNLTTGAGGVGALRSDAEIETAIRHGLRPDGRPLVFMPSSDYHALSDEDLGLLLGYLRQAAPVDRTPPVTAPGPLLRTLFLLGKVPLLHAELIPADTPHARRVTPEVSVAYGAYLANGCIGCHGEGFSGGPVPGVPPEFPPASNITPHDQTGIGAWSEADFERAMRQGRRPDGSAIDPFMPWKNFAQLTETEVQALYRYFKSIPPRERGQR